MNQIFREMFAFALAHLDQVGERGAQCTIDCRPRLARVDRFFRQPHHAGRLENRADGDLARRVQFFLQGAHGFVIGARQFGIERELALRHSVRCAK